MLKNSTTVKKNDSSLQEQAGVILNSLGLTTSEAINLYYEQIIIHNGLPFEANIPNETTLASLKEAYEQPLNLKRALNLSEILAEIDNEP